MVLRKFAGIFVCTLMLGVCSFAVAGIPNAPDCDATMAYSGGSVLALFNLPAGNGNSFTSAHVKDTGAIVDATITLIVRDDAHNVIPNVPAADMWLESADGGMIACAGGTIADVDTDASGITRWANPLAAGGYSESNCLVQVGASGTANGGVFALHFNSADLNGNGGNPDGEVNLIDVTAFATIYYGTYNFAADLFADGGLDLLDVTSLATGNGSVCP